LGPGYILEVGYQFPTKEPYSQRKFTTYLLVSEKEELLRQKYDGDLCLKQATLTGIDLSAVLGFNQDIFGPGLFLKEPLKRIVLPQFKFPSFEIPFLTVAPKRVKYVEHDFAIPIRAAVWLSGEVIEQASPLVTQLQLREQIIKKHINLIGRHTNKQQTAHRLEEAQKEIEQLRAIVTQDTLSYSINHVRNAFGIDLSKHIATEA
jgi:hypothetical protein